jgi:protein SCO1/2
VCANLFFRNLLLGIAWLLLATHPAVAGIERPIDQQAALKLSQAVIGQRVGDYMLFDRKGRTVRFSGYRGKPLLVSFIYTGCFQICPTTTRNLAGVIKIAQNALGTNSFAAVSIGFNVPFDTPQAMDSFAKQNGINLPNWDFLSPDPASIGQMTRELGFSYAASPKGFDHIEQATLIDAEGKIYRQIYGDNIDVQLLVTPLKELLGGTPSPQGALATMMNKIRLFCTVYDPASGTYRQNYSIYVEILVGLSILGTIIFWLAREWRRNHRINGA